MRQPTKAPFRLTFLSLVVGASLMTACSGGGVTAPQATSSNHSLSPKARTETGYVVAERLPGDTLENPLANTLGGESLTQTMSGARKLIPAQP